MSEAECRACLAAADCVCLDVDSTVCRDEAIDELASYVGAKQAVAAWTKKAMQGGVNYRESLFARLEIIKPTQCIYEKFAKERKVLLSPGIEEFVKLLQNHDVKVFLVTGGFRRLVSPIADRLNIPATQVFANTLHFDEEGKCSGFDESEPTSDTNGKAKVVALLKEKFAFHSIVMIGDGVTDLEACPPADCFIGYGGNQVNEIVKSKSGWFVTSFQQLIDAFTSSKRGGETFL